MKIFNDKLDIKLIRLVKDNPVLYDTNHAKYMDFNAREVAWQKIGDEMKRPAADCKVRWINIRDVNRRILKKLVTNPERSGKGYKYQSEMSFMRSYYKDVFTNVVEDLDESSMQWNDETCVVEEASVDSDDSVSAKPEIKRKSKPIRKSKKKKEIVYEEIEEPGPASFNDSNVSELDSTDPVDAFLLSIGATLKTFSPYHLNLAKSKIFAVVQEHDLQQIVQKQQETQVGDVKISTSDSIYLS